VLAALHLREPRVDLLRQLSEPEWAAALDFANRSQLTLTCGDCGAMPCHRGCGSGRTSTPEHNLERLRLLRELLIGNLSRPVGCGGH